QHRGRPVLGPRAGAARSSQPGGARRRTAPAGSAAGTVPSGTSRLPRQRWSVMSTTEHPPVVTAGLTLNGATVLRRMSRLGYAAWGLSFDDHEPGWHVGGVRR